MEENHLPGGLAWGKSQNILDSCDKIWDFSRHRLDANLSCLWHNTLWRQGCELRLVRCPFQCGVKVLVRNLEKHKNSCSMRPSAEQRQGVEPSSSSVPPVGIHTTTAPPVNTSGKEREKGDAAGDATNVEERERAPPVAKGPAGPGDPSRTVTCMRCQESMPFLLVPSHGAKCKGKKENWLVHPGATAAAAPPVASETQKQGLSPKFPVKSAESEPNTAGMVAAEKSPTTPTPTNKEVASLSYSSISRSWTESRSPSPSPQTSPRGPVISRPFASRLGAPTPLSPPAVGSKGKGWQGASRAGGGVSPTAMSPEVKVPLSPSRWKDVRTWGTRQVASWLRDIMRPPRADVISRFHDSGVDGVTLLGVTDR